MIKNYILKTACFFMVVGFAAGIAGQVELLKPGISFVSPWVWQQLLTLHVWATPISLIVICLSTVSLLRHGEAAGQWAIWLGACAFPLLFGVVISVMLNNTQTPDAYLLDTVYMTAGRHAYGTVVLLVALGGLSALAKLRSRRLPLIVSFLFAFLIAMSGVVMTLLQSSLGLSGMPRGYIDYPQDFAQLSFYTSVAAITCLSLSMIYLFLLWGFSREEVQEVEESF